MSEGVMIKTRRKKLFSMFYLQVQFGKKLYLGTILLCAVLILVLSKRCSVNEVPDQFNIGTCRSKGETFETNYPDVLDSHVSSEMVSRYSLQQNSLEYVCPTSNAFCFPSTLTGLLFDGEIDTDLDALDDSGFQREDFSAGLKQERSNLSWSGDHRIFQLLDGRIVSCTLQQQDGFELQSNDVGMKNGQQTDVSSCIRPVVDHKTYMAKSGGNVIDSGFLNGLSTPPVDITPSLLDWGHKKMHDPSLACLTVKNTDSGILSVYDPYSSNSQFYSCNFSETFLRPLEAVPICFVFLPTQLGLSSAQLVLQTSLGGFLVQVKGFAVASPYLVKPLSGFDDSSDGMWRKNISLFNPFNETFFVEEVTAWISLSSGTTSILSKAICSIHALEDSSEYRKLSENDWLDVLSGDVGPPDIYMRLRMNWQVGPQSTETIVELDLKLLFEGKIVCTFCLLLKSSTDKIDTIMVPFEAELSTNPVLDIRHGSASLEALVSCNASESTIFALSVRNDAPYLLSVTEVREVGDGTKMFLIKFIQGLVLFPNSITRVAILNYTRLGAPEVDILCKLLILINDTRNPQIEIPCIDVIHVAGHKLDSSLGNVQGINNVGYMNGRQVLSRNHILSYSEVKGMDTCEADEFVLRNWESHATMQFMSVLEDRDLQFPIIHVGNHCSQWISVKNPSQEPVVMQLILNSGEVIDKCRTSELLLYPSSSSILLSSKSAAPTSYGFSLPKDAITEAFIHPNGRAFLGPILFHPSSRCQWRSSALIRNNLSGVESLSLRGFGGSFSLVFNVGSEPVQSLEFEQKSPTQLNISSTDMYSTEEVSCSQPLTKDVYVKNMGDLSVEVVRIDVSGSECGLDGFLINNCEGFSLQPGESARLHISYHTDFSSSMIQRDLELALASGILVIPMKASLPPHVLHFCRRSMFWMGVKKSMVGALFAVILFFLACFFFPHVIVFTYQDIKSGKKSSSTVNCLERLTKEEEVLALESAGISSEVYPSCRGNENPTAKYQEKSIALDDQQGIIINSSALSKSSSVANFDVRGVTESRNLRVIIGKEKGRRRKKKKSYGAGAFELSSSHSGSSTPSSPLSPVLCITPRRLVPLPLEIDHSMGNVNTFDRAPDQKHDNTKHTKPHSKINLPDNEVSSKCAVNNWGLSAQEKPGLTKKLERRAVLFPSATFPSAVRATYHSQYLASTSTIAPHARAPGSKINIQKAGELEDKTNHVEKTYVEEKAGVENFFTYDIWGDHLFGLPFTCQSKQIPSKSTRAHENNSESFFVGDPPTLFTKSLLNPTSRNKK